ncbi:MAG: mviN2 [Chloroflexi bacterium]|nr:mviN2 [Chloroflexota bacterium]
MPWSTCIIRGEMQSAHTPATSTPRKTLSAANTRRRRIVLPAAGLLMVAFLLSRVLGMVRQVLFTSIFGTTGIQSDAYITAFRAPELVFNLVSGGALTSAFIPTFAGYLARKSAAEEAEGWRVASTVFYLSMVVLLPILVLAIIFAPLYVPWLVGNNNATLINTTIPLTRIMLLQPLFMALITVCQGVSNSYSRFTAPALAPLVYNLSVIVGILVGHFVGITAVAWAVTIGAALQFAVQIPYLPQGRRLFRFAFEIGAEGVRDIGRLMLPRLFGQAGIQASLVTTTILASMLPSLPNSGLALAWTLILLPVGIFAAALATTAFPVMSRQAAVNDMTGFARTVSETMRMVFFLTVPAAAGLIILAPRVIRVLSYGSSNNELSIHLVTLATIYYAIGIPGHALAEVLPRAFFAIKDSRTPVLVVLWTLALAIFLSVMAVKFIPGDDAIAGLAAAISIAVLAEAINLTLALHRAVPEFALGPLGWSLVRANLAAGVMAAGVGWMAAYLTHTINTSRFGSFVALVICIPLGAGIYLAAGLLLRVPEARIMAARVRSRIGL